MDDFDRFNQEDMEIAFNREAYLKEKKRREAPVLFTLFPCRTIAGAHSKPLRHPATE